MGRRELTGAKLDPSLLRMYASVMSTVCMPGSVHTVATMSSASEPLAKFGSGLRVYHAIPRMPRGQSPIYPVTSAHLASRTVVLFRLARRSSGETFQKSVVMADHPDGSRGQKSGESFGTDSPLRLHA